MVKSYCALPGRQRAASLRATKIIVGELLRTPRSATRRCASGFGRMLRDSADFKEGRQAFMEKRKPVWKAARSARAPFCRWCCDGPERSPPLRRRRPAEGVSVVHGGWRSRPDALRARDEVHFERQLGFLTTSNRPIAKPNAPTSHQHRPHACDGCRGTHGARSPAHVNACRHKGRATVATSRAGGSSKYHVCLSRLGYDARQERRYQGSRRRIRARVRPGEPRPSPHAKVRAQRAWCSAASSAEVPALDDFLGDSAFHRSDSWRRAGTAWRSFPAA